MIVSEQFYSIQGEGNTAGIPAYFLRLGKCNLLCGGPGTQKDGKLHNGATWRCDTIEVWSKYKEKSIDEIISDFGQNFIPDLATKRAHLVITGGEPLMHQKDVCDFIDAVQKRADFKAFVEVETNGTIMPDKWIAYLVSQWNVSPKLANSGMRESLRINETALIQLSSLRSIFKFVVSNNKDVEEVQETFFRQYRIPRRKTYLMPGVDSKKDYDGIMRWLADVCAKKRLKMGGRLQVQLWDKTTGV